MSKSHKEMLQELEAEYKLEPNTGMVNEHTDIEYELKQKWLEKKKVEDEATLALFDKDIEKPIQYRIGIDTFDRLKANASKEEAVGFCKWNVDKYTHRKKGCDKEDIEKIKDYCDLWLWVLENK